jgi:hypothetical protein
MNEDGVWQQLLKKNTSKIKLFLRCKEKKGIPTFGQV